jgi:aldehyde:ferredoxin oxidoreductase
LKITWGEEEKIRKVVDMIASRRGIGDMMANGAKKLAEGFCEEAQNLVMHVKGLDIICGDPRGIKAYGLTYAIASRGADHLRAEPYFELTDRKEEARKRFGTEKAADRLEEEGKATLVSYSEKIALLCDCLTMCKNIGLCMDILSLERACSLLRAGTGVDYAPEYLEKILSDAVDRDHAFNKWLGMTREDDTLPQRFREESLPEGPTKGETVDIRRMVDEYYKIHRWED